MNFTKRQSCSDHNRVWGKMSNPYLGRDFDRFLEEEGMFAEVAAGAIKKLLALQIQGESVRCLLEDPLDPFIGAFQSQVAGWAEDD